MKRLVAMMLAGLLLLGCLPAQAANYTVDEKFFRQLEQNAVKGTLRFSAAGSAPEGMEEETWQSLTAALSRISLDFQYSQKRGEGEADVEILVEGEKHSDLVYLFNDALAAVGGSAISPDGAWYAAPKDWDLTRLIAGAREDAVPAALLSWCMKAHGAPAEWQEAARTKADEYLGKLSLFINGFAQADTGSQEGVLYSELSCALEPDDVKAEMMLLLENFFEDEEFLNILRSIASMDEAALLFDPALLPSYLEAIRKMPLEGQVKIIRRYDVMGHALLDSITLPFAKGAKIASLTLSASDTGKEKSHLVSAVLPDGNRFEYRYGTDENGRGKGSVQSGGEEKAGVGFSFDWQENEETYSLQTDLCERAMQGVLTLTREGKTAQTIRLDVLFSSKSEKRSPSTMTATLLWQDAQAGAALQADLTLKTAAAWAVRSLDGIENAVRLDQLDAEEIRQTVLTLFSHLGERLSGLIPGV